VTVKDAYECQSDTELRRDFIEQIEKIYSSKLDNNILKKLFSLKPDFYDLRRSEHCRKLTDGEILNFSNYFGVDVVKQKIIPLFELVDSSYIVWDYFNNVFFEVAHSVMYFDDWRLDGELEYVSNIAANFWDCLKE
jgi:hypothetical protein